MAEKNRIDLDSMLRKRSPEELNEIVKSILSNQIFLSTQIKDASLVSMVFMPLSFAEIEAEDIDRMQKDLGVLFSYHDSAFPRSINGMPMFREVWALCKEDWNKVRAVLEIEENKDYTDQLK